MKQQSKSKPRSSKINKRERIRLVRNSSKVPALDRAQNHTEPGEVQDLPFVGVTKGVGLLGALNKKQIGLRYDSGRQATAETSSTIRRKPKSSWQAQRPDVAKTRLLGESQRPQREAEGSTTAIQALRSSGSSLLFNEPRPDMRYQYKHQAFMGKREDPARISSESLRQFQASKGTETQSKNQLIREQPGAGTATTQFFQHRAANTQQSGRPLSFYALADLSAKGRQGTKEQKETHKWVFNQKRTSVSRGHPEVRTSGPEGSYVGMQSQQSEVSAWPGKPSLMSKNSKQILQSKLKAIDDKEKMVIEKYFKRNQDDQAAQQAQDDEQFGLYIDYYIKQSDGYEYVTDKARNFELGLLDHVKRIRDGSALVNPQRAGETNDKLQTSACPISGKNQSKLIDALNSKIKANFKIDDATRNEAMKLFMLINQKEGGGTFSELDQVLAKQDLKLFISYLIESSDQKIQSNKTFVMLRRLEKAVNGRHNLSFNDFVKFICKPDSVNYSAASSKMKALGQSQKHLSQGDLQQLWTAEDEKKEKRLKEKQLENRRSLRTIQAKLAEVVQNCAQQLQQTLKTLQDSGTEESLQTLAAYQKRRFDDKQKTLDIRNRKVIASRMYGVDQEYLADHPSHSKDTTFDYDSNPFLNKRDLSNLNNVIRKLNDHIDKLDIFQRKAHSLSDLEVVQQKVKQFGEALGFVQNDMERREMKEKEDLEDKKIKKFLKSGGQSQLEMKHIEELSKESFMSIRELNQMIRRREIIVNINNNYMDTEGKTKGQTWKDKVNYNKQKIMEKKQKEAQDIEEISCSEVPKSELDLVDDRGRSDQRSSRSSCAISEDLEQDEDEQSPLPQRADLPASSSDSEDDRAKARQTPSSSIQVDSTTNGNAKFIVRSMAPQAAASQVRQEPSKPVAETASTAAPQFKRVSTRTVQQRQAINFHASQERQNPIEELSESDGTSQESSEHVSRVSDFDSNQARAADEDEPDNADGLECSCNQAVQRKFQDQIQDGKGEIWLFRAKTTPTEHSFDVYSFRNLDAVTKGVIYMSLKDGVASIVTKSCEDDQKNNLYFIDKGNQSLLRTFGDFENLEIGSIQLSFDPATRQLPQSIVKSENSISYVLQSRSGKLKKIINASQKQQQLAMSALLQKRFKHLAYNNHDHYMGLLTTDGQELCLLGNLYGARVPNIDLLKFERIKLPTKIAKISTGCNHIVALAESKKVFSWGVGSSGQLGHGDYETQKYPTMMSTIYNGILDILAVGNSTVFLDDFNNIRTCGCNLQGQLGDDSMESHRNIPDKLGKQFLLHNILMFKGHYDELQDKHTLSFLTDENEIYIWGSFKIPINGSQKTEGEEQAYEESTLPRQPQAAQKGQKSKFQSFRMSHTAMIGNVKAKLQTEVQHQRHNNDLRARKQKYLESTIHKTPQKLNFIFDKSLGLKIKSYEIDYE